MLFAGNKICHPDLALGCCEQIFGRYKASLKTVAASLGFTVWQGIDTYRIFVFLLVRCDLISFSFPTKLGKCKDIFNVPFGRKYYPGIFCLDFLLKALFSRIQAFRARLKASSSLFWLGMIIFNFAS